MPAATITESTISETRAELIAQVIDIPGSDGHRYQAGDDLRHEMDAAKIVQVAETREFASVQHWWSDTTQQFTPSVATSESLLDRGWQVSLTKGASIPTRSSNRNPSVRAAFAALRYGLPQQTYQRHRRRQERATR